MGDDAKGKPDITLEHEAPKERFVRTFQTDSAALRAGGKPDFISKRAYVAPTAETSEDRLSRSLGEQQTINISPDTPRSPLPPPPPAPAFDPTREGAIPESPTSLPQERLVHGSLLPDMPALAADMVPVAPLPPGAEPAKEAAPSFAPPTIPAPAPTPAPTFTPKPPPQAAPKEEPKDTPAPIETYTGDFAAKVEREGATTATILAAEQDAAAAMAANQPSEGGMGPMGVALISAAVLLVVLGAGGAYYALHQTSAPATVAVAPAAQARIFVDERAQVSGTGPTLATAIAKAAANPLTANSVLLLTLSSGGGTNVSVFSSLQLPAPDILLRNINSVESLAGVVNVAGTQSPFFILAVESYSNTFAGMLQWEPKMQASLAILYPLYPAPVPVAPPVVATSTKAIAKAATSTPPVPTLVPNAAAATFKDIVVSNHDARVLRDNSGRTLLIYGYWDQTTLIIARDENAFTEIVGRLANSRTQQ